jgi:UDP-3-O-[3-hydroxymyristoyl] N-acetylglucosamine deacetylase/3-hydroxyacyl-[acyl-carrier-protein] dehydratase
LGNQYAQLADISDFAKEIAPCRTFVFFHELEILLKNNLIKGGDLQNAIVIMEHEAPQEELDRIADLFNKPRVQIQPEGILNNLELHFQNEPARHKLLDIMGDLALVGRRIKGKIIAKRPGHYANTELAKTIRKLARKEAMKPNIPTFDLSQPPLLNILQIRNILPHRPPFLLIDKILHMDENTVTGLKNVTMNEGFFVGHFPDEPVMPGVLQIEAMAQVGGIFVLNTVPDPENYITYFLKIDRVKFKRKVVPGDTIIFRLELIEPIRRGIANMFGQAFVGDQIVMEGEMLAQIIKMKQ